MRLALCHLSAFFLLSCTPVLATPTRSHTVSFQLFPHRDLRFSGSPQPLYVRAGCEPAVDSCTTYDVRTNHGCQQIMASLDTAMPPHVALTVELEAPDKAFSMGEVPLSTSPRALVTNIRKTVGTGLMVVYRLHADAQARGVRRDYRTITYTLCDR